MKDNAVMVSAAYDTVAAVLDDYYKRGADIKSAKDIRPLMEALRDVAGLVLPSFSATPLVQASPAAKEVLALILSSVDEARLSDLALVTVLRTTCAYSDLTEWTELRDRAHAILLKRDQSADEILRGLY
ncbi:MAG: hypothetical protein GY833_22555 [Aestuariibacter sp.]|nr:hypothetical protein [Aestuariibacter sp.]|tara:strand:+ start:244810 stop:245196 length:387 start_codon:yes stop_codon:yes gene_type:complete